MSRWVKPHYLSIHPKPRVPDRPIDQHTLTARLRASESEAVIFVLALIDFESVVAGRTKGARLRQLPYVFADCTWIHCLRDLWFLA